MNEWFEAIARGDFSAILNLVTTVMAGGFGTALTIIFSKFVKYKMEVTKIVSSLEDKLSKEMKDVVVPAIQKSHEEFKSEVVDSLRNDLKVVAESIALSANNDASSRLAMIENISKIGISEEVKEQAVAQVYEETAKEEEHQEQIQATIEHLENNSLEKIETL